MMEISAPDRDRKKTKVLIVDDEPDTVKSTKWLLEMSGFDAETATSGEQAVQWAEHHDCDAVLLDVAMPKTNGLVVAENLQKMANVTSRQCCIILITGCTDPQTRQKAAELGITHYLLKPADPEVVLSILHSLRKSP